MNSRMSGLETASHSIWKCTTLQEAIDAAPMLRPHSGQSWYWSWADTQLVTRTDGRTYKQMSNNGSAVPIPAHLFNVDQWGRPHGGSQ